MSCVGMRGAGRAPSEREPRPRLRTLAVMLALASVWSSSTAMAAASASVARPMQAAPRASAVVAVSAPSAPSQTIVDRIVAVVGDQVITLSDVRMARAFGLVAAAAPGEAPAGVPPATGAPPAGSPPSTSAETPLDAAPTTGVQGLTESQIIERLVDRELMRAEVERFGTGEPPAAEVESRVQAVQARFASPDAFRAALEANGLSEARFRAWIADDLRIVQYIDQRFGASSQPTDEEVLQYYQSREREFAVDGRPRPFDEVRELVRRRLGESRRQAMVDDWVSGLRRRTAVALKTID